MHTRVCCAHPFFGFVCTPNAEIDFSDKVPEAFGHAATATIDRDGFRNAGLPAAKPAGEVWIGVFGGSVAFSVASTRNETTIAGELEALLNAAGRARVRVLNLALPGGQQPQQAIVLMLNLHRLDGVITFDGVNELVVAAYYNQGVIPDDFPYRPYYEALFGQDTPTEVIALNWLLRDARRQGDTKGSMIRRAVARRRVRRWTEQLESASATAPAFRSLFAAEHETDAASRIAGGALRWARSVRQMAALCAAAGVPALFCLQPVPEYQKPLTELERAFLAHHPDMIELRRSGYPRLLEHAGDLARDGIPCAVLSDVFASRTDAIYTDHIHFEDLGCSIVARRLAREIAAWSCLQ